MTDTASRVVKVTGPAGVLAALHYVLGFHPASGLYVVGLKDNRFTCVICRDYPDTDRIEQGRFVELAKLIANRNVDTVALVGYGPDADVRPIIDAAMTTMATIGVPVAEAIRTDHGRYYSYLCHDTTCCPPEGTPYAGEIALAADLERVLDASPDRQSLQRSIEPEDGPSRAAVEKATHRIAEQIEAQMREPGMPHALIAQTRTLIGTAVEAYRRGERLSDDDVARLSVLIGVIRLRDEAWMTIIPDLLPAQLALWSDLTRRAAVNIAACASLLAFAAWLDGDNALAALAINRALSHDPGYSMAHLMTDLLMLSLGGNSDAPATGPPNTPR
ncbi:DUF4192 domain-containing protein [Actinoallomurus sp. NBC_01490]|uniref:DUF4192 domain-containing protein n=1 Tax=Actinoallomurus sp. NBC_01490 TaxID=2903557 RepID=UPI002E30EA7E|nr:DUF4192 domain-containing protein [Actinoallomurus sp. NBC_01490]